MIPENLLTALAQAPFVLVIVYLAQRFLSSMDEHDRIWMKFGQEMHDSMQELSRAVRELSELIVRHDR